MATPNDADKKIVPMPRPSTAEFGPEGCIAAIYQNLEKLRDHYLLDEAEEMPWQRIEVLLVETERAMADLRKCLTQARPDRGAA